MIGRVIIFCISFFCCSGMEVRFKKLNVEESFIEDSNNLFGLDVEKMHSSIKNSNNILEKNIQQAQLNIELYLFRFSKKSISTNSQYFLNSRADLCSL